MTPLVITMSGKTSVETLDLAQNAIGVRTPLRHLA